ncbi:MAG TPA: hypothetical protein VLL08_17130 [Kineosporiaceae bacterium]|nr:hypothetical protein [Kineosporiaceae bacterium]
MTDGEKHAEIVRELQQLRRGQGLHATDVMARVGPRLTQICDLDPRLPIGIRRQRLVESISAMVTALPADLRLAVQAAYALQPADQSRFLRERMEWLGQRLNRDPRTAVRRVESGLALLAERMLSGIGSEITREDVYAPDGWYVDSLRATLLMNVDPVQLLETRRVTSTQESLEQIAVSWSIPADIPAALAGLRVEMLYGGELHKDESASTLTFWAGHVRLPRPLRIGEQHEFQVRVTSLPRRMFRPYYVLSPFRRCDEFMLRAKFDRSDAPVQIWTLDGVPFQLLDENQPVGEVLEPDRVGEVVSHFRHLRQGLSYGLRWRYALADAS